MYTLLWQGFCEDQVKWCIWNYFRNYNALYSQTVIIIAGPNVSSWENLSLKEDEDQVLTKHVRLPLYRRGHFPS